MHLITPQMFHKLSAKKAEDDALTIRVSQLNQVQNDSGGKVYISQKPSNNGTSSPLAMQNVFNKKPYGKDMSIGTALPDIKNNGTQTYQAALNNVGTQTPYTSVSMPTSDISTQVSQPSVNSVGTQMLHSTNDVGMQTAHRATSEVGTQMLPTSYNNIGTQTLHTSVPLATNDTGTQLSFAALNNAGTQTSLTSVPMTTSDEGTQLAFPILNHVGAQTVHTSVPSATADDEAQTINPLLQDMSVQTKKPVRTYGVQNNMNVPEVSLGVQTDDAFTDVGVSTEKPVFSLSRSNSTENIDTQHVTGPVFDISSRSSRSKAPKPKLQVKVDPGPTDMIQDINVKERKRSKQLLPLINRNKFVRTKQDIQQPPTNSLQFTMPPVQEPVKPREYVSPVMTNMHRSIIRDEMKRHPRGKAFANKLKIKFGMSPSTSALREKYIKEVLEDGTTINKKGVKHAAIISDDDVNMDLAPTASVEAVVPKKPEKPKPRVITKRILPEDPVTVTLAKDEKKPKKPKTLRDLW
jgi:hypothetical protein